jgi:aminopeptidase N
VAQCPDIASEVFDALEWQEEYTQIPYPFAKYDLIILPEFQFGGMEHTGATLYTDGRMFLNENPTLNARDFAYVVRGLRDDGMVQ